MEMIRKCGNETKDIELSILIKKGMLPLFPQHRRVTKCVAQPHVQVQAFEVRLVCRSVGPIQDFLPGGGGHGHTLANI